MLSLPTRVTGASVASCSICACSAILTWSCITFIDIWGKQVCTILSKVIHLFSTTSQENVATSLNSEAITRISKP